MGNAIIVSMWSEVLTTLIAMNAFAAQYLTTDGNQEMKEIDIFEDLTQEEKEKADKAAKEMIEFHKAWNDEFVQGFCDGPPPPCDIYCPFYEEEHDMGATITFCNKRFHGYLQNGNGMITGWHCLQCRGISKEEWKKQQREKLGIKDSDQTSITLALLITAFILGKEKREQNGE